MDNNLLTRNFLKPKNESIKFKKLYGFDIETYGDSNKFIMGSIVNETEKYIFWNLKELQNFLFYSHKMRGAYIFATNLGFDFLGTFGESFEMLSKFKYIIRGSDFVAITYKYKRNKIIFKDTMNFLKVGVANLGKILGIPKMEKPSFLGEKPKTQEQKDYLEKYNIQDSYISFKFAEYFQNACHSLGGNMKYTIASSSMDLFRNKYLKYFIQQPNKEVIKYMFKGYYGGRTEAFYRGRLPTDDNYNYYDINSLYPFVMSKYMYPFPNSIKFLSPSNINLVMNYEGLTKCKVITPKNIMYPLLPYRFTFDDEKAKKQTKLLFPVGTFYGWYTHIELRKAIELGYKIEPIKTYYFPKLFNPFKPFVNDLYTKRLQYKKEGNSMQLATKILMNSLYGKLAQKLEQSDLFFVFNQKDKDKIFECFTHNEEREKLNEDYRYKINTPDARERMVNGKLLSEPRLFYITDLEIVDYPKFINPILAIYVTSYARLELYKLIEEAYNNGKQCLYCDTDSIITNHTFNTSKKLGALKLEYNLNDGIIVKPKFYYLNSSNDGEVYKCKGLFGIKTYKDFENLLETRKFTYMKFTKFKESVRRKLDFNSKLFVNKEIGLEDNKRIWKNKFDYNTLEKSEPFKIKESKIKI